MLTSGIAEEIPESEQQLNLQGDLILAAPSLRDPNFARSVLLLTEHSHAIGAHGYILNRPIGKTVGEVLPSEDFPGIQSVPIFFGGPVDQEQLTFASLEWNPDQTEITMQTHLSTSRAADHLEQGATVRAYVGYAGWGQGQLEAELQQRAWITCRSSENVIRSGSFDELWADLLKSMGPYHTLLAATPDDPSLN